MATFKISAWDVAELLGLKYVGEEYDEYKCYYVYKFKFHGKDIVDDLYHDSTEGAKEFVAEGLLWGLGEKFSRVMD